MDYRYYYKRAFYLACIASGLIKHKEMKMNFKFCYQNGSPLQPVISAFPTTGKHYAGHLFRSPCLTVSRLR